MLRTDTDATGAGWRVTPLVTIGETIHGYTPPGILDGVGVFAKDERTIRVLVNHELKPGNGSPYELAGGLQLRGARISYFDVDTHTLEIGNAGVAYDTVYDRNGKIVTEARQINRTDNGIDGIARLCSAVAVRAGEYGFVDDVFFAGEELGRTFHGRGGTAWALDVERGDLWAVPAMGRAAFENVAPLDTGTPEHVALLIGDDRDAAPLYLYVGHKNARGDGSFLDRNGLAAGQLYAWRSLAGDRTPEDFHGSGESRDGVFVELHARDETKAGTPGHDRAGYLDATALRALAAGRGAFAFARPEDVHTNPADGRQAVFAASGLGKKFPSDNWGTVYVVDVEFPGLASPASGEADARQIRARVAVVHDADSLAVPDSGIRNPDNLVWARDGFIYVQEDRATYPASLFGAATHVEASIWQLDPRSGATGRIAEIDRLAVAPRDATDSSAGSFASWESSGIVDVSDLFAAEPGETVLIATVQAHGIKDGSIGGNLHLTEGGQLVVLENRPPRPAHAH